MSPIFTGACTAMITPFDITGKVDLKIIKKQTEYQLENNIDALLVLGTTGEASVLTDKERKQVLKTVIRTVNGKIPVLVGAGSNNTKRALKFAEMALDEGADAHLQVTPYYNKTTQQGLIDHYTFIADRVDLPMILYNVPSRTGMSIRPETYAELSKHPRIAGTKEASGNITAAEKTLSLCSKDFFIYCGDDALTVPFLSVGAKGVISVISNILPNQMHNLCEDWFMGKTQNCEKNQVKLQGLIETLFSETNPIPIKEAMHLLERDSGVTRLPLSKPSEATKEKLKDELVKLNV